MFLAIFLVRRVNQKQAIFFTMIALSLEELTPRISHGELRVYYGRGKNAVFLFFSTPYKKHQAWSCFLHGHAFYMVMAN